MPNMFTIALSPAQRWALYAATRDSNTKITTREDEKKYRRWKEAFGMTAIVNQANRGTIDSRATLDYDTFHLFNVTMENIDTYFKLLEKEKTTGFVDICGDLSDKLEDLEEGKEVVWPDATPYDLTEDIERWLPKK